ncbi:MAG: hypothetical protein ABEJ72_04905 [Candidatus Aenigmatarchaeota archaeon]
MAGKSRRNYLIFVVVLVLVASGFYLISQQGPVEDMEPKTNGTQTDGTQDGAETQGDGTRDVPGSTDLSKADRVQEMAVDRNPTVDFYPKDKIIFQGFGIRFKNNLDTKKTIHFKNYDTSIELEPGQTKGYVFTRVDKYTIYFEHQGKRIWGSISVKRA